METIMSRGTSFVELEKQFDDAMATVTALYELMWSAEIGSDFRHETIQKIGRGGLISAKKAEAVFRELMELYFNEQQEMKRKMSLSSQQKKPASDPLVERAVSILDKAQVNRTKQ
jgi:hypothetical protein